MAYAIVYIKGQGRQELSEKQWDDLYTKAKEPIFYREDGPAVELADGNRCWCIDNKLHREDGPATENSKGEKRWYIEDIEYTESDHKWIIKDVDELPLLLGLVDPRDWVRRRFEKKYKTI